MEPIVIKLHKPVQLGETGTRISELHLRSEITAGDLRGIKLGNLADLATDDLLKICGRLCGQPDPVMNRLSLQDFGEVASAVLPLLQGGQPTQTAPSL